MAVGHEDPVPLGLAKHQRISREAARAIVLKNYRAWDEALGVSQRWTDLKASSAGTGPLFRPPAFQTKGVKCGLTVLIDFEDERATIPREEVSDFLNGETYAGFGNNGSVKQYFADNSNGTLTYTNVGQDEALTAESDPIAERELQTYCLAAMAHHQLNQTTQARAALDKAAGIVRTRLPELESGYLGENWSDYLLGHLLLREVRTLIDAQSVSRSANAL